MYNVATDSKKNQDDPNISFVVPNLNEILKLRQDPEENNNEAYKFFIDKILGCVVGKRRAWSKDKKCFKTVMASGVTVSDEAFALLIMENQWNVVFNQGQTKCTTGTANKRNAGWSKQGIERFNQLVTNVKQNRSQSYALQAEDDIRRQLKMEYYPMEQYGILQSPSQVKKRKRNQQGDDEEALPLAFVDMMSEDEEESGEFSDEN